MGIQDELKLIEIKEFANSIPGYNFVIDDRNLATSIFINDAGEVLKHTGTTNQYDYQSLKNSGWHHFVPDIIDYDKKVIIEYQESAKRLRKHTVKGHDELSDADKDLYYELAGFRQIKIWDYDTEWKETLREELLQIEV